MLLVCGSAAAQPVAEQRTGFLDCGRTTIRALAECYGKTAYCATETLSFARPAGRTIVPIHGQSKTFDVSGRKTLALEYRAASWACLPGQSGGRYLVVVMSRASGTCSDCEYSRLYDLNGRLIATDADARGRELMRVVLGGPGPHAFSDVYR